MAAMSEGLLAEEADPAQTLVVMEATGNFWMPLAWHLHRQGFAVSDINPAQAHYFAQAVLQRGKSDALDAQMLTRLAATLQPARWTPPPPLYEELRQRLTERDTLLDIRQQVRNQRYALSYNPHSVAAVEQRRQAQLTLLDQQLAQIEAEIEQLLGQPGPWAASAQRLLSIPGIGLMTAAWLLVATVNFSQAETVEQVTAYAGLAPRPRQSGTSLHGRTSIGHSGHARLRSALYMAVLSAVRFNPPIRSYYYRLLERGKVKKVALCAAARKLLHLAWTLVKKERMFDPNYHLVPA
jgi:transposase